MSWSAVLAELPKAVPIVIGAFIGGFLAVVGAVLGQALAHWATQRREHQKILREKAEELSNALCQIQHTLFLLYQGLMRDARFADSPEEGIIGNISLDSQAVNVVRQIGTRGLPQPGEYRALLYSINFDIQRVDILQRLYFLSAQQFYEAHIDTLGDLTHWLEKLVGLQEDHPKDWAGMFHVEDAEESARLYGKFQETHADILEAVAKAVSPYRKPSRARFLLRRP